MRGKIIFGGCSVRLQNVCILLQKFLGRKEKFCERTHKHWNIHNHSFNQSSSIKPQVLPSPRPFNKVTQGVPETHQVMIIQMFFNWFKWTVQTNGSLKWIRPLALVSYSPTLQQSDGVTVINGLLTSLYTIRERLTRVGSRWPDPPWPALYILNHNYWLIWVYF